MSAPSAKPRRLKKICRLRINGQYPVLETPISIIKRNLYTSLLHGEEDAIRRPSDCGVYPHVKPPLPYSRLIAEAILNTPEKRLTLQGICAYLKENYCYFRYAEARWQVG